MAVSPAGDGQGPKTRTALSHARRRRSLPCWLCARYRSQPHSRPGPRRPRGPDRGERRPLLQPASPLFERHLFPDVSIPAARRPKTGRRASPLRALRGLAPTPWLEPYPEVRRIPAEPTAPRTRLVPGRLAPLPHRMPPPACCSSASPRPADRARASAGTPTSPTGRSSTDSSSPLTPRHRLPQLGRRLPPFLAGR